MTMRIGGGTHNRDISVNSREISLNKRDDEAFVEMFEVAVAGQTARTHQSKHSKEQDILPFEDDCHITEQLNQAFDLEQGGVSSVADLELCAAVNKDLQGVLAKINQLIAAFPKEATPPPLPGPYVSEALTETHAGDGIPGAFVPPPLPGPYVSEDLSETHSGDGIPGAFVPPPLPGPYVSEALTETHSGDGIPGAFVPPPLPGPYVSEGFETFEGSHVSEAVSDPFALPPLPAPFVSEVFEMFEEWKVSEIFEGWDVSELFSDPFALPPLPDPYVSEDGLEKPVVVDGGSSFIHNVSLFKYAVHHVDKAGNLLAVYLIDLEKDSPLIAIPEILNELWKLVELIAQLLDMARESRAYTAFCMPPFGSESDLAEAQEITRGLRNILLRLMDAMAVVSSPFQDLSSGGFGPVRD